MHEAPDNTCATATRSESASTWTPSQCEAARSYILCFDLRPAVEFRAVLWLGALFLATLISLVGAWINGESLVPRGHVQCWITAVLVTALLGVAAFLVCLVIDYHASARKAASAMQREFPGSSASAVGEQIERVCGSRHLWKTPPHDVPAEVWQAYLSAEADYQAERASRSFP